MTTKKKNEPQCFKMTISIENVSSKDEMMQHLIKLRDLLKKAREKAQKEVTEAKKKVVKKK